MLQCNYLLGSQSICICFEVLFIIFRAYEWINYDLFFTNWFCNWQFDLNFFSLTSTYFEIPFLFLFAFLISHRLFIYWLFYFLPSSFWAFRNLSLHLYFHHDSPTYFSSLLLSPSFPSLKSSFNLFSLFALYKYPFLFSSSLT
jgi:hypothetical protein